MQRYEKLQRPVERILKDTRALLDGDYGDLDGEDGDLREDTQVIHNNARRLRDYFDGMNDMPDASISALAHDLRGSLNNVIGWTEIIVQGLDGDITDEQTVVYERILQDGTFILAQIDTLIDSVRLRMGKLQIQRTDRVRLDAVIQSPFKRYPNEKPITIEIDIAPDLPEVAGSQSRIHQAIYHIISNATRHAGAETIRIRAGRNGTHARIIIRDDGNGIPADALPRVFEPFYQADPACDGLGLGLTLARDIIAAQDGTLTLESSAGAGTTCTITLPLAGD